jgi:hypothetical protein
VICAQLAWEVALHSQLETEAVTEIFRLPPLFGKLAEDGLSVNWHAPVCATAKVVPATVSAPVLVRVVGFALTENPAAAEPVCGDGVVTVIHEAFDVVVQEQSLYFAVT